MYLVEQALVFIGSAVLLVPIFHRLGFGSVLGYLIAGILVGPHGLALIQDAESVMHISELGVVFLLFIIGLEIQPRKLWSMRRELGGLGLVQVLSTTIVFTAIAMAFGFDFRSALVLSFGLSLSSTAFALQTLIERNELKTDFGRASFSVLLAQDLVAIPALAVIPMLAGAQGGTGATHPGWGGLGIIVLLVVASRYLMRPLFRLIASTRSREIFTATTLFIVIGVSVLMQNAGLSAALGAFIAGVLLADSEYRHELEANLDPFKNLLMGLFFIAVGMGVNLSLVAERPVLVASLAVSYLVLKSFLIYVVGRRYRMQPASARRMAFSIAQGGEFAFVIFGLVAQLQLAPAGALSLLTAVITLSMALSPFLRLIDERIARRRSIVPSPDYDTIEDDGAQVIVAGFGRFGQMFGRVLRAQNIPFVAIDRDPEHIELVRKFGSKVYYGDAARHDIVEMAGGARAKYIVVAIDDVEASLQTVRMVIENFPQLKIFARARNRGHAFDLMALGVTMIKRETFDSSVAFVGDLLLDMGFAPEKALLVVERFRRHDEIMLKEQFKVRNDDKMFVSLSKQGTAQLEQVLSDENMQSHILPPSEQKKLTTESADR